LKLSVIIVNYNVKYFLEQCLHSVAKACEKMDAEIFVVDNNSVDGSVELVRKKFPSVKIISNRENKGFSKANNQAIRVAEGEYVLLLNPDTVVEEDTFEKILRFMDEHQEAGGLGVKMIDGSGKFLPESKRGLPTPGVAFYKMFGLSKLFPHSKTFGRYHLSYLDPEKIHEVEVLAGAFMLIRKSVLDKIGLLDETFFMYGEDIDLSYRITKAGYKNYYFPETRIIHYKGESTKKSSVNYVLVFYNAMIIFAKKHFPKKNASLFSFIIHLAIYLRAASAIAGRFVKKIFLPVLDAVLLFSGMFFLKEYWSENMKVNYPQEYILFAVPVYILIWTISIYFSGGYDQPVKLPKIIRGIFSGTILILVVYALLPETYRFSRAMILLGAVWASFSMIVSRLIINLFKWKDFMLESNIRKRLLIAGEEEEGSRVLSLLKLSGSTHNFIGFVQPSEGKAINGTGKHLPEFEKYVLGTAEKFKEIMDVYAIDEVIFCAKDIPSNRIISYMSIPTVNEVEYKIAPPESLFIIGSSSVNNPGELYVIDTNSISKSVNKRNKRLTDILLCILFILLSPVLIFVQKNPGGYFSNLLNVLTGKNSWVGYDTQTSSANTGLPSIRKGILNPLDMITNKKLDESTVLRLNSLYAKDYHVNTDLNIIRRSLRNLGRR
jgi:GT2 family glycosyltransferase